jgi:flagellar biosynthetic protein FliR
VQVTDCLTKAFFISLRIGSPFIVYSLIANFTIGLGSKLVPYIPLYFITAPAVTAGGLFLFYTTCKSFLQIFNDAFSTWLTAG